MIKQVQAFIHCEKEGALTEQNRIMPDSSTFDMMALYGRPAETGEESADYKVYDLHNETGEGTISIYRVLPGIQVAYNDIHMAYCHKSQKSAANVIEINHCREGRYECSTGHQSCCYIAPGDFFIGALDARFTDSSFPTRHYHGISIFIETERLASELVGLMELLSIDMGHIASLICNENRFFIMRANESIAHIFSELYSIREKRKSGYLKLKIMELLLFLSDLDGESACNQAKYMNTKHVQKIKQVHDCIVEDIRRHYTVSELSDRFQIAPTALKTDFAKVYGSSVYAYLKAFRLQEAQRQLLYTDASVAKIAAQVGYENPNKFATAFKKAYDVSPTAFRNNVRLDR